MEGLACAAARMGARIKIVEVERTPAWSRQPRMLDFALNVKTDRRGEYFEISLEPKSETELMVLDVKPEIRHLLLLSRAGAEKHRFLLGHDERHWFVAGIPERAPVSTVRDALKALKPEAVSNLENRVRARVRDRRSNAVRIRQGEWFFLPAPDFVVPPLLILRDEPLRRGNGKPHTCQELFRTGGETVYVSGGTSNGISEAEFAALSDQERRRSNWRVMRRNPNVYVRGRVRHSDHRTVELDRWHQVLSNTEDQSYAMRNIAFLD